VLTENGYKPAKDIQVDDLLLTATFDNIPLGDTNCSDGDVTPTCIDLVGKWNSNDLENVKFATSKVTSIKEEIYPSYIYFNNDVSKKLSISEQVLVKSDNVFVFKTTTEINVGDIMMSYSEGNLIEIPVESVDMIEHESRSLLFYREPYGLIIAGDSLAYNGCPIHMLTN
jgi:hypothetical protein